MLRFRNSRVLALATAMMASAGAARADAMLTGAIIGDNAVFAYLGTSPSTLGALVASGTNFTVAYTLTPMVLTPGTRNYLNIEDVNYGGPAGLSAVFALTGTGFVFANGSRTIDTALGNYAFWSAGYNSDNAVVAPQPWVVPIGGVVGATHDWRAVPGLSGWIWPNDPVSSPFIGPLVVDPCLRCTADFSIAILPVPEPNAWTMMILGAFGIGAIIRRRRAIAAGA